MIPHEIIEQVASSVQIEEIINPIVKLGRKGTVLVGLCPFHNEKTPSFTVWPSRNRYKCYGCGESGDAISFIMKRDQLSFTDAVKNIAKRYDIKVPERKLTDEEVQHFQKIEELKILFSFAEKFYRSQLPLSSEASNYISSRISPESIETFSIGYAPNQKNSFAIHALTNGYKPELLLRSKLVKKDDKSGEFYDFFIHRIIFPIIDNAGRVISFAGRVLPGADPKYAKYINLPETETYHKREVFYGIHLAARNIGVDRNINLVEGYTDVIKLHEIGINNTVCTSGTALTDDHVKILKRIADRAFMLFDGDKAGREATLNAGKKLSESGIHSYVLHIPETSSVVIPKTSLSPIHVEPLKLKVDPADYFKSPKQFHDFLKSKKAFISWYFNHMLEKAGEDPSLKNDAINEVAPLLIKFDKSTRELYVEQAIAKTKIKGKLILDKIRELETVDTLRSDSNDFEYKLPEGVDPFLFEKYGFYSHKNEYYFRTQRGHEKLSNFTMTPVFHINSINESKRIYELENSFGFKAVVDLDMQEMTSLQAFQRNIEGRGNFLFWGTGVNFSRVKLMLYEQTRTCNEIRVLGWQKEGFWAWANGITTPDETFLETDEYGVVSFNNENYFIPAFSKIYINDKSIFSDERKFLYRKRDTALADWINQFELVFGDNAIMGVAYWVATLFRDHILRIFQNYPLLNLFGPKGTGKSQMAVSLSYLFGDKQTPFNIHNGTKPGLAEHLQMFSNALSWVDEYKNNIEYDKIETLKSIYDSIGRMRINFEKGKKKETTNVNSAVMLSGQEMPTADVALFSRVIFLQFNKTEFTDEEKRNYDILKKMESGGLSHLTAAIILKRKEFEETFYDTYQETLTDFNEHFTNSPVEDRILRSVVSIVGAWRTISRLIEFPFDYNKLRYIAFKTIETQNAQISRSNEIGMFWNLLESLFDENIIIDKWHFRIDYCTEIKEKNRTRELGSAMFVLKFKFNTIYSSYAQHLRRQGGKPLPADTLSYYLRNHKAFFGVQDQCTFVESKFDHDLRDTVKKTQNTSAMCFNYEILGINLIRKDDPITANIRSFQQSDSSSEPEFPY